MDLSPLFCLWDIEHMSEITSTVDVLQPLNAVKILSQDDDKAIVGGYGVIFNDKDLEGETFTKDTDYQLDLVPVKPVFYDHTQQKNISHKLGNAANDHIKADELGLWVEAELDKAAQYMDGVLQLIDEGVLGWSSGTIGHLARREGGIIKSWPIVEFSLTATPAEPRTLGVERIKQLAETNPNLKALIPESVEDNASDSATVEVVEADDDNEFIDEENIMSEERQEAPVLTADAIGAAVGNVVGEQLTEAQKNWDDKFNAFLDKIAANGKFKDAGYVAPDSEGDHAEVKSFGDWLLAVKNNNTRRLSEVYKSQKALNEGTGTAGGYLVPEEFQARLLEVMGEMSVIRPRATVIPVGSDTGRIPALDVAQDVSGTTGATAYAGGVYASWGAEAASLTAVEPKFNLVQWNIHKLQGYTQASNELVADSAVSVESLLTRLFGNAVAAHEDYAFLRGTGAGEPLGIMNADCTIGVTTTTNDQFKLEDAMKMLAQFKQVGGSPVWILNRALLPDLHAYFKVTGGTDMIQPREGVGFELLGYPILFSEFMPAANSDDALLADLSAYVIFDRTGLAIAYSEHAGFTTDQATWRFTKRLDGQPWLRSYITHADSTTHSPFVYHND